MCNHSDTSGTTKNCLHISAYGLHTLAERTPKGQQEKKNVYVRPGAVASKVVRRHDLRRVLEGPAKCLIGSDFFFFFFFTLYFALFSRKLPANVSREAKV